MRLLGRRPCPIWRGPADSRRRPGRRSSLPTLRSARCMPYRALIRFDGSARRYRTTRCSDMLGPPLTTGRPQSLDRSSVQTCDHTMSGSTDQPDQPRCSGAFDRAALDRPVPALRAGIGPLVASEHQRHCQHAPRIVGQTRGGTPQTSCVEVCPCDGNHHSPSQIVRGTGDHSNGLNGIFSTRCKRRPLVTHHLANLVLL